MIVLADGGDMSVVAREGGRTATSGVPVQRVVICDVQPAVEHGSHPVKRVLGDVVDVVACVLAGGGNNEVGAEVRLYRTGDDEPISVVPMTSQNSGLDLWTARLTMSALGDFDFRVSAWDDRLAFHRHRCARKAKTGRDPTDELDGLIALAHEVGLSEIDEPVLCVGDHLIDPGHCRLDLHATCQQILEMLAPYGPRLRRFATESGPWPVLVETPLARTGAWYQFFPRSEGGAGRHGTLRDAEAGIDRAVASGFTVVYLPPVHPIGRTARKGPDDAEMAGKDDPGSPWAIGSAAGGHDAVHPKLGNEADLATLVERARSKGVEVALDYALNFSPDHPWVEDHPQWFTRRRDGSFVPAGTTDKYYQDIYVLDFDGPHAADIALACRSILDHWLHLGIRVFRVDLPHTKPLWFWEQTLADVRVRYPDSVFLAEAYTKPTMMRWLSLVGFSQSLTYFLWRENAEELGSYLRRLHSDQSQYLRPNLFVNSHDYLPGYLRDGGRPMFALRAAVAALGAPSWGVYSGYELLESSARSAGATKYAGSEIYQLVHRDYDAAPLRAWIKMLNNLRAAREEVTMLGNLVVHETGETSTLAFSRVGDRRAVLLVAALTPDGLAVDFTARRIRVLPVIQDVSDGVSVRDELTGDVTVWRDEWQTVSFEPTERHGTVPVRIFTITY